MSRPSSIEAGVLRLYRGLLFLYPAPFREEYGRELCLVFADRCREKRSGAEQAAVWLQAVIGILTEAPREHYHMIVQDIRYTLRILRKDLGVTAAAIAILGLGIGSATTVFSLANGLLLRSLPFPHPETIVAVQEYSPKDPREAGQMNFPNFLDIRARARLLEDVGIYGGGSVILRGDGVAERIEAGELSAGIFHVLGVSPLIGRIFTDADNQPKGPKVILIGEDLWRQRFGRDPKIIGRGLDIDDGRFAIVGVMPSDFHFPERAEVWFPMQIDPAKAARTDYYLHAIARLKPGVTVDQATAELNSMLNQIHREHPESNNGWRARAVSYRDYLTGKYRNALFMLLVAVGLLLAIACANVSNLLLVKASARVREMAVRTALGATRQRLIRLLVSESLILGLAGGMFGVLLAYAGIPALLALIPVDLPLWMSFSIDLRVLAFAFGVCLLTSLIFGLAPAFASSDVDLATSLKEGGRGSGSGLRHKLLRNSIVVAEIAISVMLLAGAGLMIRSFIALRMQDLGYRPESIVTMQVAYPEKRYENGAIHPLLRQLREQVAALPRIQSIAFSTGAPLADGWGRIYTIEGRPLPLNQMPMINHIVVTPGYFTTLGISILSGRDFIDADFDAPRIVIVSESFVKQHWPGESALGKRIRFGPPKNNEPWHTIVGVVANSRHGQLKGEDRANVYLPFQVDIVPSVLLARASGDPLKMVKDIQRKIAGVDKDLAISQVYTLEQIVGRRAWQDRFWTVLLAAFSTLALLLAAVGLYAVLSYTVSLNRHEIGIRMALGAPASSVRSMVLKQGVALAAGGIFAGLLAAFMLTRLLSSLLYETSPLDPAAYIAAPLVLMSVALLAAFLPARRAVRVDPIIALRQE